jgi:excisionase family DNA binding protein
MKREKSPSVEKLLISLDEGREMLGGISLGHLRNLKNRGEIRFVKVGRRTFIEKREIERFLAQLSERATAEES